LGSGSSWYREFMSGHGVEVGSHKPRPGRYTGPPMDLANMRKNGVRCLLVHCLACAHQGSVNVDEQPDDLSVKSFEKRMTCSKCGSRMVDVRPDWKTSTKLRIPQGR
jgi:hypothetical protein